MLRPAEVNALEQGSQLPIRTLVFEPSFGTTALQGQWGQGELRGPQQPNQRQVATLFSHGKTQFKQLQLEGQFLFNQEQEEGIGWRLSRNVHRQPYYLANIRPGNWDNDRYRLKLHAG
ncbi:hypothetical protein RZS08_10775, partial [Arthrospira platensis SPKY1]|nr:hypothetical protein [Arthrospira platensis SPKY1]